MYNIDGDFGQVRRVYEPTADNVDESTMTLPFRLNNGGWHRCNDLYHIHRDEGKTGHILLFSLDKGGYLMLGDGAPVSLPACSVAWIPSLLPHAYGTERGCEWEFYWLDIAEMPHIQPQELFDEQSLLLLPNMDVVTRDMEHLLRRRSDDALTFRVETSRIIGDIYHHLLASTVAQKHNRQDDLIHGIVQEMEANPADAWNLKELAQRHFLSVPQLIRRFSTYTGLTPHAFLLRVRMQTAALHLQHTAMTVDEISYKVGFAHAASFIQQFRKHYGMTPSRYRKSQ